MNPDDQQNAANAAAEEILRIIYGDDLTGCTVSIDAVAAVVRQALQKAGGDEEQLLPIYEKSVEAFHLLSTPPVFKETPTPEQLHNLLSERLDKIHAVTKRLIETTAMIKGHRTAD